MNSKYVIYIFTCLILLNITGCFTERYYIANRSSRFYQEDIDSFLITEDGSKLVILGYKYHYVFKVSPVLKQILSGSLKELVSAKFTVFNVSRDNKITGSYMLKLSGLANDELKKRAVESGFTYDNDSDIFLRENIQGIRYSAVGFSNIDKRYRLNEKYIVTIQEEESAGELAKNILITPILVLADGILVLGASSLLLITQAPLGGL